MDMDACCQAWWPQFNPWNSHGNRTTAKTKKQTKNFHKLSFNTDTCIIECTHVPLCISTYTYTWRVMIIIKVMATTEAILLPTSLYIIEDWL